MTQDEIIRTAREAGLDHYLTVRDFPKQLERFATLVAAEREVCLDCYSPDDTETDWADKIRGRNDK